MKTYERKLLNQLLQGQVLIIKRNGYCFKFDFNTRNNILSCRVDGHIRTLDCSERFFNKQYSLEERIIRDVKYCIEHYMFPVCLQINSKYWYLQNNTTFKQLKDCLDADEYYKKADLNLDKLVEKAKEFINKKKIKICNRTIVRIWSDGEYDIKKEVRK